MIELSVIIPTCNRASFLRDALISILSQTLDRDRFEIIVADNGSNDETPDIVAGLNGSGRLRYLQVPDPGLHNGRHLGAEEARGEILCFVDDDIIAAQEWLEAIFNLFKDEQTALAGGRALPKWETDPPDWIDLFKSEIEGGWTIGYLSLSDWGDVRKEIPAACVYGCNFSIRKKVLFDCGGFHPDAMPQELIRFRGDGETGLALEVEKRGYRAFYEPKAIIYHRVSSERLTVDYFCRRAFNQGVSASFTEIRRERGIPSIQASSTSEKTNSLFDRIQTAFRSAVSRAAETDDKWCRALKRVADAFEKGKLYHRNEVAKDADLLKYVLRDKYY